MWMIKFRWDLLSRVIMKSNKYFDSHLVDFESLDLDLDLLNLSRGEKKELLEIAHMRLHATILDAVLSELNEKDKKRFLELLALGDYEKVWSHLNNKVEKIEEKIVLASEQIKKELKDDIQNTKT